MTKEKHKRAADTRDEAIQFIEVLCRETSAKRKHAYILLDEEQFMAYHIFNFRMSETRAKSSWESALRNDDLAEKEDGRWCAWVRKPTEVTSTDKISSKKSLQAGSSKVDASTGLKNLSSKAEAPLAVGRGPSDLTSGLFGSLGRAPPSSRDKEPQRLHMFSFRSMLFLWVGQFK